MQLFYLHRLKNLLAKDFSHKVKENNGLASTPTIRSSSPLPDVDKTSMSSPSPVLMKENPSTSTATHSEIATQTSPLQQFKLHSLMTHLKFACKNYQSLSHMSRSGTLLNMPIVKCPSRDCPACLLVKGTKLRRNLSTALPNLRPGQLLMIDFAFFNIPSIRGYKSYLSITCQATGYTFTYSTHRKRAPVDIIKWHILALQRQGFIVNAVRFDEGGELARSFEVNKLLISLNVIMETTGGYASHLNGKDERQHRTHAEAVRSMLYLAGLPESFWCLALAYHTFLQRRWCNYPETITPYEK